MLVLPKVSHGAGLVGFTIVIAGLSTATKISPAKSMIIVIIIRNTLRFGFVIELLYSLMRLDLQNAFVTVGMISIGITLTFLPTVK